MKENPQRRHLRQAPHRYQARRKVGDTKICFLAAPRHSTFVYISSTVFPHSAFGSGLMNRCRFICRKVFQLLIFVMFNNRLVNVWHQPPPLSTSSTTFQFLATFLFQKHPNGRPRASRQVTVLSSWRVPCPPSFSSSFFVVEVVKDIDTEGEVPCLRPDCCVEVVRQKLPLPKSEYKCTLCNKKHWAQCRYICANAACDTVTCPLCLIAHQQG